MAAYLCTLHELAEPQHRRMGGWGERASLVRAVKWFDDDSPRGEYIRYQHCSLCDGEQKFYNLPLGAPPAARLCSTHSRPGGREKRFARASNLRVVDFRELVRTFFRSLRGTAVVIAGCHAEEAPGKCMGYLCENCEFLRFDFFIEALEKDTVLECRTGARRDRERWAGQVRFY